MSKAAERMRDLIDQAADGDPSDMDLWIERGRAALSRELGPESSEVARFNAVAHGSMIESLSSVASGEYAKARSEGIQQARRLLIAVLETVEDAAEQLPAVKESKGSGGSARRVFLVHGRDLANTEAMTQFLESLGLRVIPFEEALQATENPNEIVGKIVDKGIELADAIVALFTADEQVKLREELVSSYDPSDETNVRWQPRPNVIYEAGLAMANPHKRTVLVSMGDVAMFSDLSGLHILRFDGTPRSRNDLVGRLQLAGLDANTVGSRSLDVGSFDIREPMRESQADETTQGTVHGGDRVKTEKEDRPGTVELAADMEEAMPEVLEVLGLIGEGATLVTSLLEEVTRKGQSAQTAKQRLAILQKFARDVAPLVDDEETRALEFHESINKMDGGLNLLLDQAESVDYEEDDAEDVVGLLQVIVATAEDTRTLSASIDQALAALPVIEGLATVVREPMRRLGGAYRMHQGSLEVFDQWSSRAERILSQR